MYGQQNIKLSVLALSISAAESCHVLLCGLVVSGLYKCQNVSNASAMIIITRIILLSSFHRRQTSKRRICLAVSVALAICFLIFLYQQLRFIIRIRACCS